MSAGRPLLFLLGLAAVVLLVSLLPEDVFRTTQTLLVLAAGLLFTLVGAGSFLAPARRLAGRLFGYGVEADGPAVRVARDDEWRDLLRPLLAALVCVAVAGVGGMVRALLQ